MNRHRVYLIKRKRTWPAGGISRTWLLRWADNAGKWQSESLGRVEDLTAKDAKAARATKEDALNGGRAPLSKPGRMTLADFTTVYAERRAQGDAGKGYLRGAPKLDPKTIAEHLMTLRYMQQHFGDGRDLGSIGVADAEAFIDALGAGKLADARTKLKRSYTAGPQTVRKNIRNAKAIFNWAHRFGSVWANPFADFDGKTLPSEPNAYVQLDVLEKVLKAAPSKGWKALFALCRLAGLRRGEALALPLSEHAGDGEGVKRWVGIDWDKLRIHLVAEKTDRHRVVPIAPRLHELLAEAFNDLPDGATRIVAIAPNNLTREGKAIVKAAGVKPWPKLFQALRSSCENDWKQGGVAEATYCAWAGHSTAVSRGHYVSPTDAEFEAIAKPVNADGQR